MFTLPKLVPKISRKKRSIGKKWKQQLASLDAFPQLLTTHRSVTSKISEATFFQEEMGNGTLMSHLCLFYMQVSVINKRNKQMEHIKPNTPTCIFKWGSHQHKIIYKLKIILKSPVQPVPMYSKQQYHLHPVSVLELQGIYQAFDAWHSDPFTFDGTLILLSSLGHR